MIKDRVNVEQWLAFGDVVVIATVLAAFAATLDLHDVSLQQLRRNPKSH